MHVGYVINRSASTILSVFILARDRSQTIVAL